MIRYAEVVYNSFIEDYPLKSKSGMLRVAACRVPQRTAYFFAAKERLRALFDQSKDLPDTTYFLREDVFSEETQPDPSASPRSRRAVSRKEINKKTRGDPDIEPEVRSLEKYGEHCR